ncbi:uncharacterized protein RCC_06383 [Ramularia collo-cygni]|uniref:SET domain-containing protein n=1 Tax=Ramularia collo-cygni TaxID=112498 RepID=A0A2D3VI93_9PEZI|nr:uncharacterized protein RCC_06383 [Ramularia collo-cygni]CZT20523.1 uncharacterized protein RCC_06383 [Ramularia collo-cygni]
MPERKRLKTSRYNEPVEKKRKTPPSNPAIERTSTNIESTDSTKVSQTSANAQKQQDQQPATSLPLPAKHLAFQRSCVSRGVIIHPSITPASLPGRGIGLQTTSSIPSSTRILFIPESATFKPEKKLSKAHPGISPHAHLALSASSSFPKDAELKKWCATWPSNEDIRSSLPIFWEDSIRDKLPVSTKCVLERQRQDFDKDVAATGKAGDEEFEYYWAIVNSRSFHWKPPGSKPGYMVLCPFIDYLNHGPTGTGVRVEQTAKGFEVWTDRDYEAGEELLLTYGSHPNDKLLTHYGFIHIPSPSSPSQSDDSITLDHILLPHLSQKTKSTIQDTGYLGNYTLDPVTQIYCFRTQVAVRAELFSANEWEYFCLNGEDMGVDREREVEEWLEGILEGLWEEARNVKEWHGEGYAGNMVRERWRLIEIGLGRKLGREGW